MRQTSAQALALSSLVSSAPSIRQRVPATKPAAPAGPVVKWVGGKGRLLAQLTPLLPAGVEHMRHVEPFVGGAAFFFARQAERALLCDVNRDLVSLYETIRDDVDGVIRELGPLATQHSDEFYYHVRTRYNQERKAKPTLRAAMFLYMNKTCFNGLHRVNRRGEFNVPIGRYKNPTILDAVNLRAASLRLQSADIRCQPFEQLLETARPGDFVYFDPPYEPVSQTANFTAYAETGFTQLDQERLRDVYRELDRRGCKLMLSNSDAPLIHRLYHNYDIRTVSAPRAVNSDPTKRGSVLEVVVRNY